MSEFFGLQLGSANRKMVALRLADFADDAGRGIWPTVGRVAEECELSIRTVQRVLEEFVDEGMLIVVKKGGGGPGSSTRYDFDLARVRARAAEIAAGQSCAKGDSVSPFDKDVSDDAKGDSGDEKGCHGDTRTVMEPSTEPPLERGRAREEGEPEPEAKAPGERAFKRAFAAWPTFVSDSEPAARKAWDALSAEERTAAIEREPDYVASVKNSGRSKFCTFGVYLAERRWQKLPPKVPRAPSDYAPPFGPVWSAWRICHLMTVEAIEDAPSPEARWPLVQALHAKAKARQGHRFGERWHSPAILSLMEAVPVGSATWSAWEAEHAARGWPWFPELGSMPVAYFPAGGPTRLEIFVRMAGDDDGRAQAAE